VDLFYIDVRRGLLDSLGFEKIIILKLFQHEISEFARFLFVVTHKSDC